MPELRWYFDLVSPFSWIALPRVEALAARHGVAFRPVVLGALLSHWGGIGPAELAPKRVHTYRLVQFQAERAGLPMRFPPRHPFNSLAVQRLLTGLGAPGPAVRAAFEFVWAEGRDPSDPVELAALGARLGVADAAALADAPAAKAGLRAATEEAIAAGVFGVPTLLAGTELFWGADAMDWAEACLADPDLLRRGEMARLAALPVGVERRRPAG